MNHPFDTRPVIVAIAGPNGAGKSTFYEAFVRQAGLRFINADDIARELGIDAYDAAQLAESMCAELVTQGESFAFETVFSDPQGAKVFPSSRRLKEGTRCWFRLGHEQMMQHADFERGRNVKWLESSLRRPGPCCCRADRRRATRGSL